MKRAVSIIIFIVLAVGAIFLGRWYDNKLSAESAESAAAVGAAQAAAQAQLMAELKIQDVTVGTGATAMNGETLTVNYIGTLDDGTTFDSSYARNQPYVFTIGRGDVIKGWDLGLVGMKVGGKRTLVVPPDLAYGAQSNGPVPANATLHFTVQLLSVSTSTPTSTVSVTAQ
jgi:peptidylprolyl isomerase